MLSVTTRKQFGDFTLDASWTSDQPIVALVGPSGSGKTLTLQCIAGLIAPDSGRIVCAGRTLFDSSERINLRPQERRVGYVFQGYALFPHMTVAAEHRVRCRRDRSHEGTSSIEWDWAP